MEPTNETLSELYTGAACTLDGKPATVTGRLCDFATVRTLDGKVKGEWSWQAVALVLTTKKGKFRM